MFEINPFDNSHIALASSTGMIYFVSDFNTDNKPTQVELKYTINSNRGNPSTHHIYNSLRNKQIHSVIIQRVSTDGLLSTHQKHHVLSFGAWGHYIRFHDSSGKRHSRTKFGSATLLPAKGLYKSRRTELDPRVFTLLQGCWIHRIGSYPSFIQSAIATERWTQFGVGYSRRWKVRTHPCLTVTTAWPHGRKERMNTDTISSAFRISFASTSKAGRRVPPY